ncbi:MAG: hypothetical protein EPN97_00255 [Alphaproteobacteria bacterium]|nr:MAG: hypothetical protein EPN97_00255 [Alphaproteobacteria bacterium]
MPKIFFMLLFAALLFAPEASRADTPSLTPEMPSLKPALQVYPSPVPQKTEPAAAHATEESLSLAGKLEGGIVSIGGENTGWLLHKYQDGTEIGTVEIDLGSFASQARDGETVSVTGQMTTHHYVERGDVTIFVVSRLTEVKPEK